ncbi:MAG TPA: hypothetical protein VFB19_18430 [Mycobacterium sp.]|nr:hypothetical protein [Mycobacterium sp.]
MNPSQSDRASRVLRTAAEQMRDADTTWMRAVADWLFEESVLAKQPEHQADRASNDVYSNVTPAYSPSTERALEVARAWLATEGTCPGGC